MQPRSPVPVSIFTTLSKKTEASVTIQPNGATIDDDQFEAQ